MEPDDDTAAAADTVVKGITQSSELDVEPTFEEVYTVKSRLGKGSFAQVWLVSPTSVSAGPEYAAKIIDRRYVTSLVVVPFVLRQF